MSEKTTAETENGAFVNNGPLTTEDFISSSDLLRNTLDEKIVKIRPMSTPVEQLSRCAGARRCRSMEVEYYSVDTKPTESELTKAIDPADAISRGEDTLSYLMKTKNDSIFDVSETVLLSGVEGAPTADGGKCELVVYVLSKPDTGGVEVVPLNAPDGEMPEVAVGTKVIRMGRAAAELDVQTAQFAALPKKASNFCQIFKIQIEQSSLAGMSEREADWNFTDQEEVAIIDMRLGMEKNYLFGHKTKIYDPLKNQQVYFTGGIWEQAKREHKLKLSTLTESNLIDLCSKVFTKNAGSKRKVLIAGTGMIEALSKISLTKMVSAPEPFVKWGLEFKEIRSNFGSLYVVHSEIFDQCGHASDGFILDPAYLSKYSAVPFKAENLDLRSSGQRNTDAVVITEASCLVLRYPESHLRLIGE